MRRHRGERCAGFTLDLVSYCTREEHAGGLALELGTNPPSFKHQRYGHCACGREHGTGGWFSQARQEPEARPPLDVVDRDALYTAALNLLDLRPDALADLTRRGLSPDELSRIGFRSIPRKGRDLDRFREALVEKFGEQRLGACPGFTDKNGAISFWSAVGERDGYVVPFRDEHGLITGLQLRVQGGSYLHASGARNEHIYCVEGWRRHGEDLFLTEGGTKAYVASYLGGIACFGVAGQSLALGHLAAIKRLQPARAIVALDRESNTTTDLARERWLRTIWAAGLTPYVAVWEGGNVGGPKGLDDLFQGGGTPRIRPVHFVPPEMGARRIVRFTGEKSPVADGRSLTEARRLTRKAIQDFAARVGR